VQVLRLYARNVEVKLMNKKSETKLIFRCHRCGKKLRGRWGRGYIGSKTSHSKFCLTCAEIVYFNREEWSNPEFIKQEDEELKSFFIEPDESSST
jgi:hypothetical protein